MALSAAARGLATTAGGGRNRPGPRQTHRAPHAAPRIPDAPAADWKLLRDGRRKRGITEPCYTVGDRAPARRVDRRRASWRGAARSRILLASRSVQLHNL